MGARTLASESEFADDLSRRIGEQAETIKAMAKTLRWAQEAIARFGGPEMGHKGRDVGLLDAIEGSLRLADRLVGS